MRIFLAVFLLIICAGVVRSNDCDLGGVTPCEAYANADAVFIGRVTNITPATTSMWQRDEDYDQTAYVTAEKIYKGYKGRRIVLRQLGSKRAPKFINGARYLFYANYDARAKRWEVTRCGRTRVAEYVQDDLLYLNALPASAGKARVAGEVTRYDMDDPEMPTGTTERLAGIRIKITGGGKEYEVVTDTNGVYEIYDLPPGAYTAQPKIPNGLVLFGAIHYGRFDITRVKNLDIELTQGGCSGVNILLTPDKTLHKENENRVGRVNRR